MTIKDCICITLAIAGVVMSVTDEPVAFAIFSSASAILSYMSE